VVAGEVRALALRSAEAARQIKGLIEGSVERVAMGSATVQRASTTIESIVSTSGRVSQLLGEIAHGASEQSDGIGQIRQAVHELDRMTQQNAALVEQTAAAANVMRGQAQDLEREVAQFTLPVA
jgi:methyl-accepting chemotaxis protein